METGFPDGNAGLRNFLLETKYKLEAVPETDLDRSAGPGKWSTKEILGHLCDSAINNYCRFIQLQHEKDFVVKPYLQDEWVFLAGYRDQSWIRLVNFWWELNERIFWVLENTSADNSALKTLSDGKSVSLAFLVSDYLDHMNHHLRQIFRD